MQSPGERLRAALLMKDQENAVRQAGNPEDAAGSLASEARKKRRWMLLSVVIAGLSIWAVSTQWKDFSFAAFLEDLQQADKRWLVPAALCMLGFVIFEACSLKASLNALDYRCSFSRACSYSAADIYFSAITPSASGGQPACLLLMLRTGIPGSVGSAVLLLTLAMYALAILTIGALCLLTAPGVFLVFGTTGRVLIVLGYAAQIGLAALFLLLVFRERLLEKACRGLLRLLSKLHLLRREKQLSDRLDIALESFRFSAQLLTGHRGLLRRAYLFNLLQRASVIAVTMFTYLAMGGQGKLAGQIFAMQSYVVIGSNCVPIPGAMGVADYLMLDGFENFLPADLVVSMELLSRSLSFYCCVLLCGIFVFFMTARKRKGSLR